VTVLVVVLPSWKCLTVCLKLIGKAQLHCPGITRNADDWAFGLYGVSAAAYAEKE